MITNLSKSLNDSWTHVYQTCPPGTFLIKRPKITIVDDRSLEIQGQKIDTYADLSFIKYTMFTMPVAFLNVVLGQSYSRDLCVALSLFQLSERVCIKFHFDHHVPKRAYLCSHHRHSMRTYEVGQQFLLHRLFDKLVVVSALGIFSNKNEDFWARSLLRKFVLGMFVHVYGDHNIDDLDANERFWTIAHLMKNSDSMSVNVFPDREGSQFYGDHKFYFREGLFAASIFNNVAILDQIIVEPTEYDNSTTIEYYKYEPPVISSSDINSSAEYALWRQQNKDVIRLFTNSCEIQFKERLSEIETRKAACKLKDENFCAVDASMERRIKRNANILS